MARKMLLLTRDAGEAHSYLTGLGYGYCEIQGVMAAAKTDPRQQWYGLPEDAASETGFGHAVRFNRVTGKWAILARRAR